MITKRQLICAERKAYKASNELMASLERLSVIASEIYGDELNADICQGEEIEFRIPGDELGEVIRMENLISILDARKEE